MISAVIVDDEALARETLKGMIKELCPDIQVIGEAEGVRSGARVIQELQPEAIFLDIRMNDGSGFDLLKEFPDPAFGIVFTTAYDQFALTAFHNQAMHFLVKPINPDQLVEAARRLKEKSSRDLLAARLSMLMDNLGGREIEQIALRTSEEITLVKLEDIIRLEASNNSTFFHLNNNSRIMVTRTLKKYEEQLPAHQFFRTHQSHMVNRAYVSKIKKENGGLVVMKDLFEVPIARRRYQEFIRWMED